MATRKTSTQSGSDGPHGPTLTDNKVKLAATDGAKSVKKAAAKASQARTEVLVDENQTDKASAL